ncbi:MAG TPA: histidine phosphatase family protein [Candidatus Atopostipes pullistercoris]|uniref:Histidine phosphatase family protein n=1 Tax=Candidatus Atopostipes pullistercoris TaxID=2838467 RepID=A0A9D2G337_9LACT|nr:histidine phosphatase family protein [Candidatus Atopostipes pullistercoris]
MNDYGTTIYFVRHGETYFNFYNRMQGWSNTPLTPQGEIDVRRSGKGLKDVKFDAVYSSDLSRTIDTAELILGENEQTDPEIEITMMPEFREIFFGTFEGEYGDTTYKKVADHLGFETADRMFSDVNQFDRMGAFKEIDPHGHAEDFMEFWLRVEKGLLKLIDKHRDTGETILLVAHGGTIRLILENLIPDLDDPNPLLNASVSVAHYDNGLYHLDQYGDVSHFVDESELED